MTFRPSLVSLRGLGQSPILPSAERVGSLSSARPWGRCVLRHLCVRGAQYLVCYGCGCPFRDGLGAAGHCIPRGARHSEARHERGAQPGELSEDGGGAFGRLTPCNTATSQELLDCDHSKAHDVKEQGEGEAM